MGLLFETQCRYTTWLSGFTRTAKVWWGRGRRSSTCLVYCVPVSDVAGRRHLRSAAVHQLTVPRVRRSTFGSHAFASTGPTVWNSLHEYCMTQLLGTTNFDVTRKRYCLLGYSVFIVNVLAVFNVFRYTYLHLLIITYFVIGDRRFDGESKSKSKSQRSPSLHYVYIISPVSRSLG